MPPTPPPPIPMALKIEPSFYLRFHGPFDRMAESTMSLTNPTGRAIFFKIKTSAPNKYYVTPNSGFIRPGCQTTVLVVFEPRGDFDATIRRFRHKFMVQAVFAPDGEIDLNELWTSPEDIMEKKLSCRFEFPPSSDDGQVSSSGVDETPSGSSPVATDSTSAGQISTCVGQISTFNGQFSTSDGKRSNSGGKRSSPDGPRSTSGGKRSSPDGPRSTSGGKRSSSGEQIPTSGVQGSSSGEQIPTSGAQGSSSGGRISTSGVQGSSSGGQISTSGGKTSSSGSAGQDSGSDVDPTVLLKQDITRTIMQALKIPIPDPPMDEQFVVADTADANDNANINEPVAQLTEDQLRIKQENRQLKEEIELLRRQVEEFAEGAGDAELRREAVPGPAQAKTKLWIILVILVALLSAALGKWGL